VTTSTDLRSTVESFIARAVKPSLLDSGEEPLRLVAGQWEVREWNGRLLLEAWDGDRSLVRKILRLGEQRRDRLSLVTERFPRSEGETLIADLAAPAGTELRRKTSRLAFTTRFGLMLAREFAGWRVAEVSSEPNLEQSFSPLYARAMVRLGSLGVAAIAAPPASSDPAGIVAQGLIWLDWLRRREKTLTMSRLVFFLPEGSAPDASRRAALLNPQAVVCHMHTYDERDRINAVDLQDCGNAESTLPPAFRPLAPNSEPHVIPVIDGVDRLQQPDGSVRLAVRGLEFAQWSGGALTCGIGRRRRSNLTEVRSMAQEIARLRSPGADDPQHPLYTQYPEGWLESAVRADPQAVDATLHPGLLFAQVPVFSSPHRGNRSARCRLPRPPDRSGVESVARYTTAISGARLLDAGQPAPAGRRF
jgi:hypothetical protein